MDYEKKYNEALERARKLQENSKGMILKKWIWNVFPELKESDDERTRKELLGFIENWKNPNNVGRLDDYPMFTKNEEQCNKYIAWLKKQGNTDIEQVFRPLAGCYIEEAARQAVEQQKQGKNVVLAFNGCYIPVKIYNTADEIVKKYKNFCEKARREAANEATLKAINEKPADMPKVEPKFKVGDWIVSNEYNNVAKVLEINNEQYRLDYCDTIGTICVELIDNDYHLWTIQEAKGGDVLVNGLNIFIFSHLSDTRAMGYCHVNLDDKKFYDDRGKKECFGTIDAVFTPATKEQRAYLFSTMFEDGYEWDADKKELFKLDESNQSNGVWHTADEAPVGSSDRQILVLFKDNDAMIALVEDWDMLDNQVKWAYINDLIK